MNCLSFIPTIGVSILPKTKKVRKIVVEKNKNVLDDTVMGPFFKNNQIFYKILETSLKYNPNLSFDSADTRFIG